MCVRVCAGGPTNITERQSPKPNRTPSSLVLVPQWVVLSHVWSHLRPVRRVRLLTPLLLAGVNMCVNRFSPDQANQAPQSRRWNALGSCGPRGAPGPLFTAYIHGHEYGHVSKTPRCRRTPSIPHAFSLLAPHAFSLSRAAQTRTSRTTLLPTRLPDKARIAAADAR